MAGLTRERRLAAYLAQAGRTPFVWGEHDCCMFIASWVAGETGVDPAASLRGRYRTATGALRHIRRAGGFLPLLRALAATAGLSETDAPKPGDIALVGRGETQAAAIKTGIGWAVLHPQQGYAVTRQFSMITAWSV